MKKRTRHHQTIFFSNEAECNPSRATENWTRKYSTEKHCLDSHNHSLCWWKKTYIFDVYMKPWEHLIKLTAVEQKQTKKHKHSVFGVHQVIGQDPQKKGSAGLWGCRSPGVSLSGLGHSRRKGNKERGSGRRKESRAHAEKVVSDNSQRHAPKQAMGTSVTFLVWKQTQKLSAKDMVDRIHDV